MSFAQQINVISIIYCYHHIKWVHPKPA